LTGNITSSADGIVIERNNMTLNGAGFTLQGSGSNKGIYMSGRSNVTIKNTMIKTFQYGTYLASSPDNILSGNIITATSFCSVYLFNSSSNTLFENNVMNNSNLGIYLHSSSYNILSGNNITGNVNNQGIYLYSSLSNTISKNNVTNNWHGILCSYSDYNSISENSITENKKYGIYLRYSSYNRIYGNDIKDNLWQGIFLYLSSNYNHIYHNNFIDNTPYQAGSDQSMSSWDNGYPSGGNYWSDYTGVDLFMGPDQNETGSDGIGDTDYVIDSDNRDGYPLMDPWTPRPEPYITNPLNCSLIYGNETEVGAVEMNLAPTIIKTAFEYASTLAGPWTLIALDLIATDGWGATWNITGLSEGYYWIRATMIDNESHFGEDLAHIYFDPTPPIPHFYDLYYGQVVSGLVTFRVETFDEDIDHVTFFDFNGTKKEKKQIGKLSQGDVEKKLKKQGKEVSACGPSAAASCLAYWQENGYPGLYDGKQDGLVDMAANLCGKSKTTKTGTTGGNLKEGINTYIKEKNLEGKLVAKNITNGDWKKAKEEFMSCQDVMLLLRLPGVAPPNDLHWVCLAGIEQNAETEISFMDSRAGVIVEGATLEGGGIKHDWDGDSNEEIAPILEIVTVCPVDRKACPKDPLIGIDYNGTDGWNVEWDTTQIADGYYFIQAAMTDVKGNTKIGTIEVYVNNARITDITPTRTVVAEGYPIDIQVSLENLYVESAFFNITLYANENSIETKNITLASQNSTTLQFAWNTTGFAKGNYTISAKVNTVLNETYTARITYTDDWVVITILGDINGDFKVDVKDLVLVIKHFGSYPGSIKPWNPNADVNTDNKVDIKDLVLVIKHFGEHYP
jgi:parallel beta-helix repeat protein